MKRDWSYIGFTALALILVTAFFAYPAIQQEVGLNGYTGTAWKRVLVTSTGRLDVNIGGSTGSTVVVGNNTPSDTYTNPTDAVDTNSLLNGWDGTQWTRLSVSPNTTSILSKPLGTGLYGVIGGVWAPISGVGDGVGSALRSLNTAPRIFNTNGSTWDTFNGSNLVGYNSSLATPGTSTYQLVGNIPYLRSAVGTSQASQDASVGDNLTTGLPATGLYGYDGSNWDRILTTSGALNVDPGTSSYTTDSIGSMSYGFLSTSTTAPVRAVNVDNSLGALQVSPTSVAESFSNITTNTSTMLAGADPYLTKIIVNAAGTASTIAIYNDNSAPCDTSYVATLPTTTTGQIYTVDLSLTSLCVLTAGTAAANVTVLYTDY